MMRTPAISNSSATSTTTSASLQNNENNESYQTIGLQIEPIGFNNDDISIPVINLDNLQSKWSEFEQKMDSKITDLAESIVTSVRKEIKECVANEFSKVATMLEGLRDKSLVSSSSLLLPAKHTPSASAIESNNDASMFDKIKEKITTAEGMKKLEDDLQDPEISGLYVRIRFFSLFCY